MNAPPAPAPCGAGYRICGEEGVASTDSMRSCSVMEKKEEGGKKFSVERIGVSKSIWGVLLLLPSTSRTAALSKCQIT